MGQKESKPTLGDLSEAQLDTLRAAYLSTEVRLALVGYTGAGKSATGNTILGEKIFESSVASDSITKQCKAHTVERNGCHITVVDVPGFADTRRSEVEMKSEITKCVVEASPGLHAILFAIRIGRFTANDKAALDTFVEYFGDGAMKHVIAVFTHLDSLEGQTIEQFVSNSNPFLKDFLLQIQNRYIAVDNNLKKGSDMKKGSGKFVKNLLDMVRELTAANDGKYYTNENLQGAFEQLKKVQSEIIREQEEKEQDKKRQWQHEADEEMKKKLDNQKKEHEEELQAKQKQWEQNAAKEMEKMEEILVQQEREQALMRDMCKSLRETKVAINKEVDKRAGVLGDAMEGAERGAKIAGPVGAAIGAAAACAGRYFNLW